MLPIILGLSGLALTPDERSLFRGAPPAGFILFGRNVADPDQLRALTDSLRELAGRADLLVMIDQEGGRVARLGPPHWPDFPAAARFAELYERAPISGLEAARVNALVIALSLSQAGINVTTSPVLDLRYDCAHPVIGERSLGADPLQVASLGRMILDGLAAGGVAGVIKHMPGHGRAAADSHVQLPVIKASAEELEADLLPFRRLNHAPISIVAHILYPAWDADNCASRSQIIIEEVLRTRIGFEGLLVSDDIVMEALSGTIEQRSRDVLAAGCDLALHGSGLFAESARLAETLPEVSSAAADRLSRALVPASNDQWDMAELLAKRDALLPADASNG